MDYQPIEPISTPDYQYEQEYSSAAKKAFEGFSKFTNPFEQKKDESIFSKENALRVVSNIALRGQDELLKSASNLAFDASSGIQDHIAKAKVMEIDNQSLDSSAAYNNKAQLNAIHHLESFLKNDENRARFNRSIENAKNCIDNSGYVKTADPGYQLNEEVENKFFNDVRIANGVSSVANAAVTLGTGFIGGSVGGYVINGQKERIINNKREERYVEKTEEIYGSCRHYETQGVLTDSKGNVLEVKSNTGIDESTAKKLDSESPEAKKIIDELSRKQAKIFDDMEIDDGLKRMTSPQNPSKYKNTYSYS